MKLFTMHEFVFLMLFFGNCVSSEDLSFSYFEDGSLAFLHLKSIFEASFDTQGNTDCRDFMAGPSSVDAASQGRLETSKINEMRPKRIKENINKIDNGDELIIFIDKRREEQSTGIGLSTPDVIESPQQEPKGVETRQIGSEEFTLHDAKNYLVLVRNEFASNDDFLPYVHSIRKSNGIINPPKETKTTTVLEALPKPSLTNIKGFHQKCERLWHNDQVEFNLKEIYLALASRSFVINDRVLVLVTYNLLRTGSSKKLFQFHMRFLLECLKNILKKEDIDEFQNIAKLLVQKSIFYIETPHYLSLNTKMKQKAEIFFDGTVPEEVNTILNLYETLSLLKEHAVLKIQIDLICNGIQLINCVSIQTPVGILRLKTQGTDLHAINILYETKILIFNPLHDNLMLKVTKMFNAKYYDLVPSLLVEYADNNYLSFNFIALLRIFRAKNDKIGHMMNLFFTEPFKNPFYGESKFFHMEGDMTSLIDHKQTQLVDMFLCRYFLRDIYSKLLDCSTHIEEKDLQFHIDEVSFLYDLICPAELLFHPQSIDQDWSSREKRINEIQELTNHNPFPSSFFFYECNQEHIRLRANTHSSNFYLAGQMEGMRLNLYETHLNILILNNYCYLEATEIPSRRFIVSNFPKSIHSHNITMHVQAKTVRMNLHGLMLINSRCLDDLSSVGILRHGIDLYNVKCQVLNPLCRYRDLYFREVEFMTQEMVLDAGTLVFNGCNGGPLSFNGKVKEMKLSETNDLSFSLDKIFLQINSLFIQRNTGKMKLYHIYLNRIVVPTRNCFMFMTEEKIYIHNYEISGQLLLPSNVKHAVLDFCLLSALIIPETISVLEIKRCTGSIHYGRYGKIILNVRSTITVESDGDPYFANVRFEPVRVLKSCGTK